MYWMTWKTKRNIRRAYPRRARNCPIEVQRYCTSRARKTPPALPMTQRGDINHEWKTKGHTSKKDRQRQKKWQNDTSESHPLSLHWLYGLSILWGEKMRQYELPAMGISYGDKNAATGKHTRRTSGARWWVSMKVQAYSYGRETYSFRGYFSKGTCQMINDTLTGREGVKMDAMRVFRQTKRPSLIGGGLSWLNIRLGG